MCYFSLAQKYYFIFIKLHTLGMYNFMPIPFQLSLALFLYSVLENLPAKKQLWIEEYIPSVHVLCMHTSRTQEIVER